ncbi:hypothetical protein GVAV_001594 [Gurleya vavrai]
MKLNPTHKILKICTSQVLLQSGFQKSSFSSLTALSQILEQLLFKLCIKANEITNPLFFEKFYEEELINIIEICRGKGESILHVMNILPKNIDWKGRGGGVKIMKDEQDEKESIFDNFVYKFIDIDKNDSLENKRNGNMFIKLNWRETGDFLNDCDKLSEIRIEKSSKENLGLNDDEIIKKQKFTNEIIKTSEKNIQKIKNLEKNEKKYQNKHFSEILKNKKFLESNTNEFIEEKDSTNIYDDLVTKITRKEGWMNNEDYRLILENKKEKLLKCYTIEIVNLLDEMKCFCNKEIDKGKRENLN